GCIRHIRHFLPVWNNFHLLINPAFCCCCDYFQAILCVGVAVTIAASVIHNLYCELIAYLLIESRNL
ncbi:hypothetical protein, partial [Nostoc sp. 'Peltigera membranacea cyanobiont' 213]|uniref:hypothetical protein n=1 Tax=Nostoc sp. 'Peltigera membranacea cyanobiont' 213 TaxID=2014530 RepID=UPI001CB9C31C